MSSKENKQGKMSKKSSMRRDSSESPPSRKQFYELTPLERLMQTGDVLLDIKERVYSPPTYKPEPKQEIGDTVVVFYGEFYHRVRVVEVIIAVCPELHKPVPRYTVSYLGYEGNDALEYVYEYDVFGIKAGTVVSHDLLYAHYWNKYKTEFELVAKPEGVFELTPQLISLLNEHWLRICYGSRQRAVKSFGAWMGME